jgi:hypothetical protein
MFSYRSNLAAPLVALALSTSPANSSPKASPRSVLETVGEGRISYGKGSMNGIPSDFLSLAVTPTESFDTLYAAIKRAASGKFTVTTESTDLSRVIIVADVQSEQCPSCRPAGSTPEQIEKLLEQTWVITWAATGDLPLVLASPAGPMMRSLATAPRYTGKALSNILNFSTVERQFDLEFGEALSQTTNVIINQNSARAMALVQSDLRKAGFQPFAPDNSAHELSFSEQENRVNQEEVWVNGARTVHVDFASLSPEKTRVNVRELTALSPQSDKNLQKKTAP